MREYSDIFTPVHPEQVPEVVIKNLPEKKKKKLARRGGKGNEILKKL